MTCNLSHDHEIYNGIAHIVGQNIKCIYFFLKSTLLQTRQEIKKHTEVAGVAIHFFLHPTKRDHCVMQWIMDLIAGCKKHAYVHKYKPLLCMTLYFGEEASLALYRSNTFKAMVTSTFFLNNSI